MPRPDGGRRSQRGWAIAEGCILPIDEFIASVPSNENAGVQQLLQQVTHPIPRVSLPPSDCITRDKACLMRQRLTEREHVGFVEADFHLLVIKREFARSVRILGVLDDQSLGCRQAQRIFGLQRSALGCPGRIGLSLRVAMPRALGLDGN